ncbi:FAD-dependent monooxygenase [Amycolatopsis sp. NPDC023774]|uniref:FAD-dependent monooxygenase n=1 Tax=Amycolatopsis sp. NPDC023774 TaxID=3155015 RepID=UPI0033C29687
MNELHADVVVAGAGPTGLMLAAELRPAGVDAVVVERLSERTGLSKALNLQPRRAEVLDLRGLLPRAEERAFATVQEGHFAAVPISYAGWDTRHPYQLGIPQAQVEELLEERFAELGGKVLRGHELVGLSQDAAGVRVVTPELVLSCRYLVGCDGGRSTVRKLLDVPFEGENGTGYGVVADVVVDHVPDRAAGTWTSMRGMVQSDGATGFCGLIPLAEPLLYRLTFGDRARRPATFGSPVTEAEVHAAFAANYGPASIKEIRRLSRFSDASRLAARYRVGRVLLAGDAAHIHFPAGGQGLNLGVQDAANLGWKLAAALNGFDDVLDTYEPNGAPSGPPCSRTSRPRTASSRKAAPAAPCARSSPPSPSCPRCPTTCPAWSPGSPSAIPHPRTPIPSPARASPTSASPAAPGPAPSSTPATTSCSPRRGQICRACPRFRAHCPQRTSQRCRSPPAALVRPDGHFAWLPVT